MSKASRSKKKKKPEPCLCSTLSTEFFALIDAIDAAREFVEDSGYPAEVRAKLGLIDVKAFVTVKKLGKGKPLQ